MVSCHSPLVWYLTIVKKRPCWTKNVLTYGFTDFNYYLYWCFKKRSYKSWIQYLVRYMMNTTSTLGIPLSLVGLLLRLPSFKGVWMVLVPLLTVPVCAFPFRTQSTLSSVSLRTKHWNWLGFLWLYFPVQDSVYPCYSSEDQVLKILLLIAVLFNLGLGLLSPYLRTKYQISHTVERLFPVAAPLSAPKNSSHLFHWEYFLVNQVPLIPSV